MNPSRPLRADAVRNRSKILAAAREQISSKGADAAMEDIAQSAGVAVGTLYRHFPTKDDLVSAVIAEHVAEVADDAEASLARAHGGARAVDEAVGFLERVVEATAHNQAVKAAAKGLDVEGHVEQTDEARAGVAIGELIRLGQEAGDIRDGVTVGDLYLLMASAPMDQPAPARQRWLELVLPGITTGR